MTNEEEKRRYSKITFKDDGTTCICDPYDVPAATGYLPPAAYSLESVFMTKAEFEALCRESF